MKKAQKQFFVEQLIPLEVLVLQIKEKPYKEMTQQFQLDLITAIAALRVLVFSLEVSDD